MCEFDLDGGGFDLDGRGVGLRTRNMGGRQGADHSMWSCGVLGVGGEDWCLVDKLTSIVRPDRAG